MTPRCDRQPSSGLSRTERAPATREGASFEGLRLGTLDRQRLSLKQGPVRLQPRHARWRRSHGTTASLLKTRRAQRQHPSPGYGRRVRACVLHAGVRRQGELADVVPHRGASASTSLLRAWRLTRARYRDTWHWAPARRMCGRVQLRLRDPDHEMPSGCARAARHATAPPGSHGSTSGEGSTCAVTGTLHECMWHT